MDLSEQLGTWVAERNICPTRAVSTTKGSPGSMYDSCTRCTPRRLARRCTNSWSNSASAQRGMMPGSAAVPFMVYVPAWEALAGLRGTWFWLPNLTQGGLIQMSRQKLKKKLPEKAHTKNCKLGKKSKNREKTTKGVPPSYPPLPDFDLDCHAWCIAKLAGGYWGGGTASMAYAKRLGVAPTHKNLGTQRNIARTVGSRWGWTKQNFQRHTWVVVQGLPKPCRCRSGRSTAGQRCTPAPPRRAAATPQPLAGGGVGRCVHPPPSNLSQSLTAFALASVHNASDRQATLRNCPKLNANADQRNGLCTNTKRPKIKTPFFGNT